MINKYMVDLEHIVRRFVISRHFLDLGGRVTYMTISSLILNISPQLYLEWKYTDMKLSGIYTMGVSRQQTKALRIYTLLKKVSNCCTK